MASWTSTASDVFTYVREYPWLFFTSAVVFYLGLVRSLRYRNLHNLQSKYRQYVKDPYSMDYKVAQGIIKVVLLYEFPFTYGFSLQWALIKSYGIANGTKLLVATRRLTNETLVGKRSEDTGVFLYEMLISGLDSDRGLRALAKMNWIHAQYGSRITNGDLIHTLALFVLEPQRWIDKYEWRPVSELEAVALFVYWKEIGNRMGMKDLPQTLDELKRWTAKYQEKELVYSPNNHKCYEAALGLYLRDVPQPLKGPVAQLSDSFLEDYVRPSLGVPKPPAWAPVTVDTIFYCRAFIIRHFFLPRFIRADEGVREGPDGRIQRKIWAFEPWYVQETAWTKLMKKLGLGGKRGPGPEYLSSGYLPEELGPREFEKKSRAPVLEQAAQLREYANNGGATGMGCPFAFAR